MTKVAIVFLHVFLNVCLFSGTKCLVSKLILGQIGRNLVGGKRDSDIKLNNNTFKVIQKPLWIF